MKYIITNYTIISGVEFPSKPMDYDEVLSVYKDMHKNARRGLCDFPTVIDEDGKEVSL